MKTRVLLSLLALTGIAQAQTAPAPTVPKAPSSEAAPFFRDVPRDHWAFAAVQRLAAAGIIEGVPVASTPLKTVAAPAPRLPIDADVARVKTALGDNAALVGVNLNVERVNSKALLVLSGAARSEAQIHLASAITRKSAPGFAIVNQMRVSR